MQTVRTAAGGAGAAERVVEGAGLVDPSADFAALGARQVERVQRTGLGALSAAVAERLTGIERV